MKTVVEQFIEDFEKGTGAKFPEVLREGWRRMALEEIKNAWEAGNLNGRTNETDDLSLTEYLLNYNYGTSIDNNLKTNDSGKNLNNLGK